MNRFEGRLSRLWKATHTFVKAREWNLIADYWRVPLDDENVNPEDYVDKCNDFREVLKKIGIDDKEQFRVEIQKFADEDRLAYYALMHQDTLSMARSCPNGYWVKNDADGFLKTLNEVRRQAERSKGS